MRIHIIYKTRATAKNRKRRTRKSRLTNLIYPTHNTHVYLIVRGLGKAYAYNKKMTRRVRPAHCDVLQYLNPTSLLSENRHVSKLRVTYHRVVRSE